MQLARPATYVPVRAGRRDHGLSPRRSLRHDFSVLYVATNSNTALPLEYRVAGVWGGHEGSLLLWMLMLSGWMVAVARFSRNLPLPVLARTLAVMGLVSVGFLLFTLSASNPFDRLFPVPADRARSESALARSGMVLHPPLLYMGYVGFSVALPLPSRH